MVLLQNIDVSLRDGGYRNGFSFTKEFALEHADASVKSGFNWVELGYLNGSANAAESGSGLTAISPDHYIQDVADRIGRDHVALIGHGHNLSVERIESAVNAGMGLLRLCVKPGTVGATLELIRQCGHLDVKFGVNAVRASQWELREFMEVVDLLRETGVTVFYLADSNGSLIPSRVETIVRALASDEIEIGFHAHNHLGLASANAVVAAKNGAKWLDSSFKGMGKGAGNLVAEHWMALLSRNTFPGTSITPANMQALLAESERFEKEVPESAPIVNSREVITGTFDVNYPDQKRLSNSIVEAVFSLYRSRSRDGRS